MWTTLNHNMFLLDSFTLARLAGPNFKSSPGYGLWLGRKSSKTACNGPADQNFHVGDPVNDFSPISYKLFASEALRIPKQNRSRIEAGVLQMVYCISNRAFYFHKLVFLLLGLGAGRAASGSSFSVHKLRMKCE